MLLSLDLVSLARIAKVQPEIIERMERSEASILRAPFADVLAIHEAFQELGLEFVADQPPTFRGRINTQKDAIKTDTLKRILVADYDPLSRDILNRRLIRLGYAITTVDTGHGALELLSGSRFKAVLLDGMMPDLPGLEVLKKLRSAKTHTCVIMVTGKALSSDLDQAMALGADAYVTKPINFKKLVDLIENTSNTGA